MQTQSPPSPSTTLYSHHRPSPCRHRRTTRPATAASLCASCLRERLAGIDTTNYCGISNHLVPRSVPGNLHRSKSHREFNSGAAACSSAEPRRRSCEAVAGTSLKGLFSLDDGPSGRDGCSGFGGVNEEGEIRICDGDVEQNEEVDNGGVRDDFEGGAELRTVREFIDLEWESKKRRDKDLRGFWGVAAVLTDKLRKWRRKEKITNRGSVGLVNGGNVASGEEDVDKYKVNLGELGDIRTEVGECVIGRRSCDSGRVNSGGFSYDVPRASLDGHMIGRSSTYRHLIPAVSAVNDVELVDDHSENRVSIEDKLSCINENDKSPGGCFHTRYYRKESPALQRQMKSFERSNSCKKAKPEFEVDEAKKLPRLKPSPTTTELFYGTKMLITEQELMDWRLKSVEQDDLATLEPASQNAAPFVGRQDKKRCKKLQLLGWRKAWNTWSLMHSRGERTEVDKEFSYDAGEKDSKLVVTESPQERNDVAKEDAPIGKSSERLKLSSSVAASSKSAQSYGHNIDNGLHPVYLAPLRTSRSKSERMSTRTSMKLSTVNVANHPFS